MAAAGHSAFSPSGSKMWLTCSGSLIPNILAGDQSGEEAAEGSVAHHVAEQWLSTGRRPKKMIGEIVEQDGFEIEVTDEMMAYVGDYVDWCEELREDSVKFLIETRVDLSDLMPIPDQGGTSDCIALVRKKNGKFKLYVRDLKFGKGVRVIADENTQGMLYAYGSWKILCEEYDIDEIEIGICHPRLVNGTTTFDITPADLLEWTEYVKQRAADAWQFNAPRTPSPEGCQWCKVAATCAARYKRVAEVTSGVFDGEDDDDETYTAEQQERVKEELEDDLGEPAFRFRDPARLSTAAMAKILRYRKMTEQFFQKIEDELIERAISREEKIPGWKLVEGRTRRKWPDNDGEVIRKLLGAGLKESALYTMDMISPAEAEKKLHGKAGLSSEDSAKLVNSLAIKPRGNRSLVRVSDNRSEVIKSGDVFADDDD